MLASPHYGEQWGRHWLDVVRFAESDGYEYDMHRPDAWRYPRLRRPKLQRRQAVQRSSSRSNSPATRWTRNDETYLVASGFNRLGPLRKNAGNQDVASSRNEVLTEMTNIVGAAFLGVTVGCARCHDHKFDPFRQSDYYRLQGFFAQAQPNDLVRATKAEQDAWNAKVDPLQQQTRQLQMKMQQAPEEEKGKLQAELDAIDEQMPLPLDRHLRGEGRPEAGHSDPDAVPRRLSGSPGDASARARLAFCCPRARRKSRSRRKRRVSSSPIGLSIRTIRSPRA